jgi:hypothetical protein
MLNTKALAAAPSAPKTYVEDVFSTWLYTGNSSTQTITNGIDLAGEGGLVWIKERSGTTGHALFDTNRGATKLLQSNTSGLEQTQASDLTAFTASGFTLNNGGNTNISPGTYASWTFRKAEKFFDVVTYTGTGSARTVSHNLGSVPGCMIVKRMDTTGNWAVYHRSLNFGASIAYLVLNSTAAEGFAGSQWWDSTNPTSTVFSVGTDNSVNASGGTYVAYLFAHNAGGFGNSGSDSVVSCGNYTGNGSATGPSVTLNWEPQWLLIKSSSTGDWQLIDNMRGLVAGGTDAELNPNLSNAESTGTFVTPTATGFQLNTTDAGYNASSTNYIYIAIRRGPMKTPTDATKVFDVVARTSTNPNLFNTALSYVDSAWNRVRNTTGDSIVSSRLTGRGWLRTNQTTAETTATTTQLAYDYNNKINPYYWSASATEINWLFRRAPGFFDVVAYTGTGSAGTVSHNLGVVPELMIVKRRSATDAWQVYAGSGSEYLVLNTDAAKVTGNSNRWNSTAPTSTVFSLGTDSTVNASAATYIAYLFATLPGVSKMFTFTGNGGSQTINCGFTAGARFVLIKRTDSTGNWLVADTARGIVSGDDPLLYLNSTAAEITNLDWLDPDSSGFIVNETATANANVNGATYIGLAIA